MFSLKDISPEIVDMIIDEYVYTDIMTRYMIWHVPFFHRFLQGIPVKKRNIEAFLKEATLPQLKWAFANGLPTTANVMNSMYSVECMEYIMSKYNFVPSIETVNIAAMNRNLTMVTYLREQHNPNRNCDWDADVAYYAAKNGDIDMLIYAHENGCKWSTNTTATAASYGSLACLEYAHKHGCPWDENTCSSAAEADNLDCLKYAHENGCPWDANTYEWAIGDCFDYAITHGCPQYI